MGVPVRLILRALALGHVAWGLILLMLAAWFAFSGLRVLPVMSRGITAANLLTVLLFTILLAGPPAALGTWMLLLGRQAWKGDPGLRARLLWTHGLSLPAGALALTFGIAAWRAAESSAAHGGGLLGGFGAFPIGIGAGVIVLAAFSISVAWAVPLGRPSRPAPVASGR